MSEPTAAEPLSKAEIRKLKGQAQRLEASVRLGRGGVSPAFLTGLDRELAQHQLVKVRLYDLKEQRHEVAEQLARQSASHLVTVIGHVVVLYRPKPAQGAEAAPAS
ncbi:MAG: YhbY family RNA-binding protein [Verrucomicrobium sp.]|jgi:RNA-binding protein|nr:YhbY family RNA-binding protein [Verrucomicrobium sp.]